MACPAQCVAPLKPSAHVVATLVSGELVLGPGEAQGMALTAPGFPPGSTRFLAVPEDPVLAQGPRTMPGSREKGGPPLPLETALVLRLLPL